MLRYCVPTIVFVICISLQHVYAQQPSSIESLTHLYKYQISSKESIDFDSVVDPDLTKFAFEIESASTPSPPTHIVVRYRNGDKDLLLIPRPDNDNTKGAVFLKGKNGKQESLGYISPCGWSSDGISLLVSGHDYGQPPYSVWCINTKTMKGTPVSRVLKDEYAYNAKFSPNNKYVAYVVAPIKHGESIRSMDFREYRVLLFDNALGQTKRVAKGLDMEWSPNSKRLLVTTANQIWVVDINDKHEQLIYPKKINRKYFDHTPKSFLGESRSRYLHVQFGHIGWIDDNHIIVSAPVQNGSDNVLIMDDNGRVIQTIPSADLAIVWGAKKKLILTEKLVDGKFKTWLIKY